MSPKPLGVHDLITATILGTFPSPFRCFLIEFKGVTDSTWTVRKRQETWATVEYWAGEGNEWIKKPWAESHGLELKSRSESWPFWRTCLTNSWVGSVLEEPRVLRWIMADWTAPAGPGMRGVSVMRWWLQGRRKLERSESSMSRDSHGSSVSIFAPKSRKPSRGKQMFFLLFLLGWGQPA